MKIEDIIEVRCSVELVTLAQLLQVCFCHSTCGEAEREGERENKENSDINNIQYLGPVSFSSTLTLVVTCDGRFT